MPELTSYWPDDKFCENAADEFHALFFPPAPPANMKRFRQTMSAAIDQQKRHDDAEAKWDRKVTDYNKKVADHYEKVKQDRRLRNKEAGPPRKDWLWSEDFLPEGKPPGAWILPELAEPPEMVVPAEPTPAWHERQRTPPEIILLGQYVILAIVHDNSDAATNRGRPRLLDGFDLPPAFALLRKIGPGTPNEMRLSGFDRRSIERALEDVEADLAAHAAGDTGQPTLGKGARQPGGGKEWTPPMPKIRMMDILRIGSYKTFNTFADRHGIKNAGNRKTWQLCIDDLDATTQEKFKKA